jgi:hypothetical protein
MLTGAKKIAVHHVIPCIDFSSRKDKRNSVVVTNAWARLQQQQISDGTITVNGKGGQNLRAGRIMFKSCYNYPVHQVFI